MVGPSPRSSTSDPVPTQAELLTVGHGRLDRRELAELLTGAGVGLVVDVRRFPGSRRSSDVRQDVLARWLPEEGIEYRWEERLGGRRRVPAGDSPDVWWRVEAFRAYAAHTRTPEFLDALGDVLADTARTRTAVMCSETVWWRCHRRLIADVVVVGRGVPVRHLMPGGRIDAHRPAEGARLRDDGLVVWDGAA